VEVGIDPRVRSFKPDRPVALVSPGRGAGSPELVGVVPGEELGWSDHAECFLVVGGFAKERVEEKGAFVPPVSVQFGVVGANNDGFNSHDSVEMLDLFFPVEHEVGGVLIGTFAGKGRAVRFLVLGTSGDAVIFKPCEFSNPVGLDVGADVVVIEVETAVSIEVPVFRVSRVALLGAPNLLAGFDVATEGSGSSGGKDGGENAVGWTGFGIENAVSVDNKPANFSFLEIVFDSRKIGTFGEPNPPRIATKAVSVIVLGDLNLGPNRLWEIFHQGQEAVGGSAGNDFEDTCILKFSKGGDQVTLVAITKKMAAVMKAIVIEAGERLKGRIVPRPVEFFIGEFDLIFQPMNIAILKQGIPEHGAEGRSH